MLAALLLGALQGVVEWLPVSSEGVVAAVYSFAFDSPVDEAIAYALWLHLGTAFSVLVVFRSTVVDILKDLLRQPSRPSPLLRYLLVSVVVSAVVGAPLLLALDEVAARFGALAMVVVGLFMLVTGALQLRRGPGGSRTRDEASVTDAVLAGVAQGLAVLPGLSRSGLTVAVLLARQVDRREALVLSFLMSVPASLGAAVYGGLDAGPLQTGSAAVAAAVACLLGLVAIRGLLAIAERTNLGAFVIIVGVAIVAGAVWQAFN